MIAFTLIIVKYSNNVLIFIKYIFDKFLTKKVIYNTTNIQIYNKSNVFTIIILFHFSLFAKNLELLRRQEWNLCFVCCVQILPSAKSARKIQTFSQKRVQSRFESRQRTPFVITFNQKDFNKRNVLITK